MPSFLERARVSAIWLLRLESLILVGIVLYLIVATFTSDVSAPGALIGEIVFALFGSAGLFISAKGFAQSKSYGRAPAVLANGIAMGVSYFMITGGLLLVGIPLGILGFVTFVASLFGYSE